MKIILLYLTCVFSLQLSAAPVNLSKTTIGESRVDVDLKNFTIATHHTDIRARFITGSLRFERNIDNLLTPKVLVGIAINIAKDISIIHNKEVFIPTKKLTGVYSEIWVDLFNPQEIFVYQEKDIIDTIRIESINNESVARTQLIDYSCSPYQLKLTGMENQYVSVGCQLVKIGKLGKETPRLEVSFSTTNFRMKNGTPPPYKIILENNESAQFTLTNAKNEKREVTITASLPKRLHRLKTAIGFGPYVYDSHAENFSLEKKYAPSLMLYGKFDISEASSFKFFDAALIGKSFFNNAGLYFSYDLAEAFDGRVIFSTLLGFQGLNFKAQKTDAMKSRFIYPQGFEVLYKHPFNRENEYITYGMFLSTDNSEDYTNAWFRWGKKYFYELNYIRWKHLDSDISMWGLSVGIPLFSSF